MCCRIIPRSWLRRPAPGTAGVVGEILADLAEKGETGHDIALLRLGRFLVYSRNYGVASSWW